MWSLKLQELLFSLLHCLQANLASPGSNLHPCVGVMISQVLIDEPNKANSLKQGLEKEEEVFSHCEEDDKVSVHFISGSL